MDDVPASGREASQVLLDWRWQLDGDFLEARDMD
jgi:hypothetical protein